MNPCQWHHNQHRPLPSRVAAILLKQLGGSDGQRQNEANNTQNLSCKTQSINNKASFTEPFFGDVPGPVPEGCFRIHSVNVGGIGVSAEDPKNTDLCVAIRKYQTDILLLQELGNNWSVQPKKDSWRSRLEKQLDMRITRTRCSHNEHDPINERAQVGGTGILTYGLLHRHARGTGCDKANLGRWTWSKISGRDGHILRCVSFYRPSNDNNGELSAGAQHTNYFRSVNDDRPARRAFLEDFEKEVKEWLAEGDHLVIGGDINESVLSKGITELFESLNLRNLIFERHDATEAPATYNRNKSRGVVDGLWGSPFIEVAQSGFLESGDFPGDHAAVWSDITFASVLGHKPPSSQAMNARRMQLSDSKSTNKYLKLYDRYCAEVQLDRRVECLEKQVVPGQPLTSQQQRTAENLDTTRTILMNKAEKGCRKLRTGAVDYSMATEIPRLQINFWKAAISRRKGVPISPKMWKRKKRLAGIKEKTRNMSLQQMQDKEKEVRQEYRVAKKSDKDSRIKFMDTFSDKDKARLKKREEMARMGRLAKSLTGKDANKSVTTVIDRDGTEHVTKEAIDAAILTVNEAKFREAEQSPFLQELANDFGYTGHAPAVNEVLAGKYNPPESTTEGAKLLLKTMQIPREVVTSQHSIQPTVTLEEHIRGWKKAKERTTSGLSGLHFGLFKANIKLRRLARIDASLRNIAYSTGYVYKRWCKGTDVQILKKSKDYRIHKLRTILLLEADFNMNNKQLGRDIMWKAERDKTLANDNYGGRKKLRAVEVSLNTTLTYNSIWARRGRAVILSNDAKGCFDRISHMVAYICLLRLGAPKAPLQSMIQTIQQLRHHIRTAYGDSTETYGGESEIPLQGLLQGSGMAPPGWAAVSAVLVQAMRQAGFGYSTWSAISERAIQITCFAFVDDTDLIHSIKSDQPTEELLRQAQTVLHTWEDLLQATGGALAPEKSYWYLVEVIRKNGSWQYQAMDAVEGELYMLDTDDQGNPIPSKRLSCDTAKEALGVFNKPTSVMDTQVAEMKKKVKIFCDAIRTKKMVENEAWFCFNMTIMRTLEYPLMATTLSKKDLAGIMSPLLRAILPKCSMQKNFPRKLLYGTLESQGGNLHDPWIIQLVEHLLAILRHGNRQTPTTDLLIENMEQVQVHVGSEKPFWELPFDEAGFLAPSGWISHTWSAISESAVELKGPLAVVKSNRYNDAHIMDVVRKSAKFTVNQQHSINNVRMRMGVTRVSDISTAKGDSITKAAWNGSEHFLKERKAHSWPKTYKPSNDDWVIWKDMLNKCLLDPHRSHRRLARNLGAWNAECQAEWEWWYSPSINAVWRNTNNGWERWQTVNRDGNGPNGDRRFRDSHKVESSGWNLPENAGRIDVRISRNGSEVTMMSQAYTTTATTTSNNIQSIHDAILTLPESSHWATKNMLTKDDAITVAAALAEGSAVAVSDGSLKSGVGTAAYTIEGPTSHNKVHGVNQVPGPISEGDSYRCELAGIYAMVVIVNCIAKYHRIVNGKCTLACDNESALKVFECDHISDPKNASYDLVVAIKTMIAESPVQWTAVHVKGHQDRIHRPLTRLEQLNIRMDIMAKKYWRQLVLEESVDMTPKACAIYGEGWGLWCKGGKIVQPSRNTLYATLQDPVTMDWWVRHERISLVASELIDWHNNGRSLRKSPLGIRRWTVKHASDNCGCGTTLVKWKKQDDDRCPRCEAPETTSHVLRCNADGALEVWQESIKKIEQRMHQLDTNPELKAAILSGIQAWRKFTQLDIKEFDDTIMEAVLEQQEIGWRNFIEGLWSRKWAHLQQRHYNKHSSRRTGKKWMETISKTIKIAAFNQWQHRNNNKHNEKRPRHKEAEIELNHHIADELCKGSVDLPLSDQHHFEHNVIQLIQRPLKYKQAWLSNVTAVRQRQERKRLRNDDINTVSKKRSKLLEWAKTGRAT